MHDVKTIFTINRDAANYQASAKALEDHRASMLKQVSQVQTQMAKALSDRDQVAIGSLRERLAILHEELGEGV